MRIHWLVGGLFALGLVLQARPAVACRWLPTMSPGEPGVGAQEVPTDVVPYVLTNDRGVSLFGPEGEVTVERVWLGAAPSGSGYEVLELRPSAPLLPNAEYSMRMTAPNAQAATISFRTGGGPSEARTPSPPSVALRLGDLSSPRYFSSSCGPYFNYVACVKSVTDETLELSWQDQTGTSQRTLGKSGLVRARLMSAACGSDICFEVRTRDVAGRRSEPVTVCPRRAETFSTPAPEGLYGVGCEADGTPSAGANGVSTRMTPAGVCASSGDGGVGVTPPSGGGCSCSVAAASRSPSVLVLCAIAACLSLARRRLSGSAR